MMIAVNDLRQGTLFEHEGEIYQVVDFKRHKMARAKAVVNIKARNLQTNSIRDLTFKSSASVAEADVQSQNFDFVYYDERKGEYILSDPTTRKRYPVDSSVIPEEQRGYLSEGTRLIAYTSSDPNDPEIYTLTLPQKVDLKVTQAPPVDKGDTASGGSKPVEVETGIKINTPFFIEAGDVIRVNTETGEYIERVSA